MLARMGCFETRVSGGANCDIYGQKGLICCNGYGPSSNQGKSAREGCVVGRTGHSGE